VAVSLAVLLLVIVLEAVVEVGYIILFLNMREIEDFNPISKAIIRCSKRFTTLGSCFNTASSRQVKDEFGGASAGNNIIVFAFGALPRISAALSEVVAQVHSSSRSSMQVS
jgi:hypothetical protein